MAKGFKDKPVDYFYFTYWYTIYLREYYSKISDQYCFQGLPKSLNDLRETSYLILKIVAPKFFSYCNSNFHKKTLNG
uniref:Uncharacterized protein n=1 Tax=Romanomermis culicivorax TaxID=13658 RepID=A0A915KRM0_ROMCU